MLCLVLYVSTCSFVYAVTFPGLLNLAHLSFLGFFGEIFDERIIGRGPRQERKPWCTDLNQGSDTILMALKLSLI